MIGSLAGRSALVTGGTDGIGKAIARRLALKGAHVLIVGSNPRKGTCAEKELRSDAGHEGIQFLRADLGLMTDVVRLGDEVDARIPSLHYLVLCAGIVRGRHRFTPEGIESNFAVGYLSRFVLTQRLFGLLQRSATTHVAARILVIGGAARNGRIHYHDINLTRNFGTLRAVSQLCESNDVFVIEQARRLAHETGDSRVTIMALKVGVVRTNIRHEFPLWMKLLVPLIDPFLAQKPQRIADYALRLLLSQEFERTTGALFQLIRRFKRIEPSQRTRDPAEGRRLWDLSIKLAEQAQSCAGAASNAAVAE